MKKRTFIAIIITIISIIATNKYWLIIQPLPINFDIQGYDNCSIEVQLNKKDNDEFKKIKSESIYVNLEENKHVDIIVKRARFPKRIKVILSNIYSNKPITISNFQFRNGKYKLSNFEKFKVDGAQATKKDNSLVLTPDSNTITLIYPDTLHVRASIHFDFMVFSIILILVYLLACKLSNYIAEFNTIKGKSRVETIFLTIFFVLLFIPMLHINQDDISKQENRTLAKWKPIIDKNNAINFEFGNNFNEWFNDRFNLRQVFLDTYNLKLILSKNWITKDVMKGADGWLFLGWKEAKDSYTNSIMFTEEELASIDNYLNDINEYCEKHNKNFYFIIAPDKSKIYSEYYPQSIKKLSDISRTNQLMDYIQHHSKVKIIYPKDKLLSKKGKDFLYWKNDTHWNLLGAYYGYFELMQIIKQDYPNIFVYKIKEYTTEQHTGDLYNMAPSILRKADNTAYTIPKLANDTLCKNLKEDSKDMFCSNINSNIHLLMYRDSFSSALIPYLSHSFGNSKYLWKYDINPNDMRNANIIVLEVVERYLPTLVNKQLEVQ